MNKLIQIIRKSYLVIFYLIGLPLILPKYFNNKTGKYYNIGFFKKIKLILKFFKNNIKTKSASNFIEHLVMATEIMNMPSNIQGVVVECGSYKGGSTTNLSLICDLCNRKLEVFDSFEGLPEPKKKDKIHTCMQNNCSETYNKGSYTGSLKEVKKNIQKYGCIAVCKFNKGYFEKTLPYFKEKTILVFTDADLLESTKTCIKYLWPLLNKNCCFFVHEAQHSSIVNLFFDNLFWEKEFNIKSPGLIGAGTGLGLLHSNENGLMSAIGYVRK